MMRKINFGKEGEVMLILNVFWTTPFLLGMKELSYRITYSAVKRRGENGS